MDTFFEVGSERVELIMPREQGERLRSTCFRGRRYRQAGNFFVWDCFLDFLRDEETRRLLTEQFQRLIDERNVNRKHRFELEFSRDIGWDSVVGIQELTPENVDACELRKINAHTTAFFLPRGQILAHQTTIATVVLRMSHEGHWKFIVGTVYPGPDCGELSSGNLTASRQLVWLDWSNPGE